MDDAHQGSSLSRAHVTVDKETFKQLANNPKLISGIHNYCDRWCERCPQTARCAVYAIEAQQGNGEERDPGNQKFWQKLRETLSVAMELLKEAAEQHGIDPGSLSDESAIAGQPTEGEEEMEMAAKAYARQAGDLLDVLRIQIEGEDDLGFWSGGEASIALKSRREAREVINWYQHLIYVKLRRASHSRMEEPDESADIFDDSMLSAKVALVCIDRSLAAWAQLRKLLHSHGDEIFDILVHLDRLRRSVETAFPSARACLRPGFEDIDLSIRGAV